MRNWSGQYWVTCGHDNIGVNHIGRLPVIMTMQVAGLRYLDVTQLGKLGLPCRTPLDSNIRSTIVK